MQCDLAVSHKVIVTTECEENSWETARGKYHYKGAVQYNGNEVTLLIFFYQSSIFSNKKNNS